MNKPDWQQFKFSPHQFNHTAEFGIPSSERNAFTGVNVPKFKPLMKLHFARRNQSIADRYQAAGTSYQDTLIIVIRHNRQLSSEKVVYVRFNNQLYKCLSYSVNDDDYNAVDLLTLKHVEKVG